MADMNAMEIFFSSLFCHSTCIRFFSFLQLIRSIASNVDRLFPLPICIQRKICNSQFAARDTRSVFFFSSSSSFVCKMQKPLFSPLNRIKCGKFYMRIVYDSPPIHDFRTENMNSMQIQRNHNNNNKQFT